MELEYAKLWKKEANRADAQYIKIFDAALDSFAERTEENRMPTTKSNVISRENIRETKDKLISYLTDSQIWNEIMSLCNTSVRFAEIGTEQMSIAFANRSEWFYLNGKLKKSLKDIDLAKSGNCPSELLPDLESRRKRCEKALSVINEFELSRPKLSFRPHSSYPGFSDVLQIQHNEEFGYHVIAKCDIDIGKTVVVEECFTSASAKDQSACATCQRKRSNFIPCEKCTSVQFCDEDCKEKNLFHVLECGVETKCATHTKMISQSILIVMRMFPNVESLIEFMETLNAESSEIPDSIHDQMDNYRMFLKLHSNFSKNVIPEKFVMIAHISYSYLVQLPAVKNYFVTESHQRFLMHLVVKHTIVQKNGFCNTHNKTPETAFMFTASALFNHSCYPNLLNQHFNDHVCITCRPIKKGEQLFISYLDRNLPTSQRKSYLEVDFEFDCKCEKCIPIWKSCDREAMESSEDYKYMRANQRIAVKTSTVFKQFCEQFLNKYGRFPWCPEIGFIVNLYEKYFDYEP